jgi:tripartite-type tricarboxylate transporter receptor subunit TctC
MKTLLFRQFGLGIFLFVITLLLAVFGYLRMASAEPAADFYKGKTIRWICPFSPGGGYDTWSRVMAPAIKKLTGATVVVKNMPGGSGLVGSNYMYTKAKRDGLTMGITQSFTMVIDQLFDNRAVKYDFKKFTWIGRVSTDEYVFSVGKDSPYKSLKDIRAAERFKIALDSRTAVNGAGVTAFSLALNLQNARVVAGYAGSSEVKLAVLTNESNGTSTSIGSQWQMLKSRKLIPVAVVGKKRSKVLPDVPSIYELNPDMSSETKRWVDRLVTLQGFGRAVIAPPGIPKDKADFIREVVRKAVRDPKVVNKLEKTRRYVVYLSPAEYLEELKSLALAPEEKNELKRLLLEKY